MTRSRSLTVAALAAATVVAPAATFAAAAVAPTLAVAPTASVAPTVSAVLSATEAPGSAAAAAVKGRAGAWLSRSATASDGPLWLWPLLPRPALLRQFEAPATRYGRGHRGIDLAARPGDDVRSVDEGVVTHAARLAGRGTITVLHASGLRSTYEPVRATVQVGDVVGRGGLLGVLEAGPAHCGDALCLHLGALRGGDYVDPLPLLIRGVILLPVREPR